jgi:hypothetical protein
MRSIGAFAVGFVVGWTARSALGPTRELLVEAVVLGLRARERVMRVAAQQMEWVEDLVAEGRARYHSLRGGAAPVDEQAPVVLRSEPWRAA